MSAIQLKEHPNGLNALMRSIGTAVSSAVVGMVLADTANDVGGVPLPTMHGFRLSFLIATAAAAVGVLFALLLPKQRPAALPQLRAADAGDADEVTWSGRRAPSTAGELGARWAPTHAVLLKGP